MASNNHGNNEHHIIPLNVYYKVISLLLFLTVVTVAAARVDFGKWNTVIAMLIASIKAGFVLAFFMHLKYDNKIYRVLFGSAIFFLVVLYFFSILDIVTRVPVQSILQ